MKTNTQAKEWYYNYVSPKCKNLDCRNPDRAGSCGDCSKWEVEHTTPTSEQNKCQCTCPNRMSNPMIVDPQCSIHPTPTHTQDWEHKIFEIERKSGIEPNSYLETELIKLLDQTRNEAYVKGYQDGGGKLGENIGKVYLLRKEEKEEIRNEVIDECINLQKGNLEQCMVFLFNKLINQKVVRMSERTKNWLWGSMCSWVEEYEENPYKDLKSLNSLQLLKNNKRR